MQLCCSMLLSFEPLCHICHHFFHFAVLKTIVMTFLWPYNIIVLLVMSIIHVVPPQCQSLIVLVRV